MYIALVIGGSPKQITVAPTAEISSVRVSERGESWSLNGQTYPTGIWARDESVLFEHSVMGVFDTEKIEHIRELLKIHGALLDSLPKSKAGINFARLFERA